MGIKAHLLKNRVQFHRHIEFRLAFVCDWHSHLTRLEQTRNQLRHLGMNQSLHGRRTIFHQEKDLPIDLTHFLIVYLIEYGSALNLQHTKGSIQPGSIHPYPIEFPRIFGRSPMGMGMVTVNPSKTTLLNGMCFVVCANKTLARKAKQHIMARATRSRDSIILSGLQPTGPNNTLKNPPGRSARRMKQRDQVIRRPAHKRELLI
jgi:hypothetical protein